MADPARKLSPEEIEHTRNLAQGLRKRQVDSIQKRAANSMQLLTSDDDEVEEEYSAPDLQLLSDDDEEQPEEYDAPELPPEEDGAEQQPKQQGSPEQQLQQGQVPEYKSDDVFKQPGAQQAQPGGPAVQPKKTKQDEEKEKANQAADMVKDRVKDAAKKEIKAAASQAWNVAKKAIAEAAKQAAKVVAQLASKAVASILAATSEFWVPILLIILAIIIIIVGAVFLIRALQTPNANGSSPVQAADIIADHELLRTILSLSSEAEFQSLLDDNKAKLLSDIDSFISDLKSRSLTGDSRFGPTEQKLEQAKTLINAYSTPDRTKASEIKVLIVDAVKPWAVTLKPGGMIWPPGDGYRHITNSYRHESHDGIDVMLPIGTPLYAATDGTIVYLYGNAPNWESNSNHFGRARHPEAYTDEQNHGFGNMMIVEMDQPIGDAKYWEIHHLTRGTMYTKADGVNVPLKVGDRVRQGDLVALSGHNGCSSKQHLHFGTCSEFHGSSCNGRNNHQYGVDPYPVLGWSR